MSQLRHTEPVLTGDDLFVAVRDPDTHFLVVPVSHTTRIETRVTKNGGAGLAYVDVPVVSLSSYELVASDDGLDFETFLRSFLDSGSNKGLRVSFRDPRVVVPVMKALEDAVDRRVLNSPIALEAEVLPGPNGYLPRMACVFKNASAYHDAYLWDDYDYDGREDDSNTTRAPGPRPPPASCSLRQYQEAPLPTRSCLSIRWVSCAPPRRVCRAPFWRPAPPPAAFLARACASPRARTRTSPGATSRRSRRTAGTFPRRWRRWRTKAWTAASAWTTGAASRGSCGGTRFAQRTSRCSSSTNFRRARDKDKDKDDAGTDAAAAADLDMIKLPLFFSAAKAMRAKPRADGLHGEVDEAGAKHRRRVKTRVGRTRRRLHQMDFEVMAEAEAAQMAKKRREETAYAEERSVAAATAWATRLGTYEYLAEASSLLRVVSYGPEIGVEQLRLLRNASWYGDAWFPHSACALSGARARTRGTFAT